MGGALPCGGAGCHRGTPDVGCLTLVAARRNPPAIEAAEQVARHSYGKLIAYLCARTRDIAGAEDALSEAFAAALDQWDTTGIPANPEGWLLTVARRRLIDTARQRENRAGA